MCQRAPVHESLLAGVPMLLLPQMSEQAIVARRVVELGAGIALGPADVTLESAAAAGALSGKAIAGA